MRFERCPTTITLYGGPACRPPSYRFEFQHRYLRVRGALVLYDGGTSRATVFSGNTVTSVQLGRGRARQIGLERFTPC